MKKLLPAVLLAVAFLLSLYLGATQINSFWSALVIPGNMRCLFRVMGYVSKTLDHYVCDIHIYIHVYMYV